MTQDRKGKAWLADEIERLKERFNEGLGAEQIAAAHGRTVQAILSRLEYLGLIVLQGRMYHKVDPDAWYDYRLIPKN